MTESLFLERGVAAISVHKCVSFVDYFKAILYSIYIYFIKETLGSLKQLVLWSSIVSWITSVLPQPSCQSLTHTSMHPAHTVRQLLSSPSSPPPPQSEHREWLSEWEVCVGVYLFSSYQPLHCVFCRLAAGETRSPRPVGGSFDLNQPDTAYTQPPDREHRYLLSAH